MSALHTRRLRLLPPDWEDADAVADFLTRNTAHFAPWDPPRPHGFASADFQRGSLQRQAQAFAEGSTWRWYVELKGQPNRVIAKLELSSVVRGPHQSAFFGFAIDREWQGQGLMHEAAEAVVKEAFGPTLNLHRLQAAHRIDNLRSAALLDRLGFLPIGVARDYLFIDGQWRDHRLVERINPDFRPPEIWT